MNIKEVHDSWKQKGFPYYPTDTKWRNEIFNQLINFKRDTLIIANKKPIHRQPFIFLNDLIFKM